MNPPVLMQLEIFAGKPVIVGEFGSQRPMAMRNAVYEAGESYVKLSTTQ